mmetsp:Transcript_31660/g.88925  ORF Transcript_31660/g.88925 Transcript_31660/m.88925 type:complete len:294 (-) Transcript_31660:821-1702(-)
MQQQLLLKLNKSAGRQTYPSFDSEGNDRCGEFPLNNVAWSFLAVFAGIMDKNALTSRATHVQLALGSKGLGRHTAKNDGVREVGIGASRLRDRLRLPKTRPPSAADVLVVGHAFMHSTTLLHHERSMHSVCLPSFRGCILRPVPQGSIGCNPSTASRALAIRKLADVDAKTTEGLYALPMRQIVDPRSNVASVVQVLSCLEIRHVTSESVEHGRCFDKCLPSAQRLTEAFIQRDVGLVEESNGTRARAIRAEAPEVVPTNACCSINQVRPSWTTLRSMYSATGPITLVQQHVL